MTIAPVLIALAIAASVWIAALLAITVRRRVPLAMLLAVLALFSVANAAVVGRLTRPADAPWDGLWLSAFLLAHAAFAVFAGALLGAGRSRLRGVASAGIALLGGGLAVAGIATGWRGSDAFQPATDVGLYSLTAFPVVCLAIAFWESLAAWRNSAHRRREAWLVVMGTVGLLVGGPVYGFELTILGHGDYVGTNLAVPVAAVLFAQALLGANPLAFRGRPVPSAYIPWSVPPGVYLLDEVRPTYAEATFLALARTGPALAIAAPGGLHADLIDLETVFLPPGERCAAVLAATAAEFLSRHPDGAVLIDDASYVVTHNGPAAVDAIRSVVLGMREDAALVVSLAKLAPEEREPFRTVGGRWLSPPDFHMALGELVRSRLGSSDLLNRAARAWGKRPQDLAVSDVPALLEHLRDVLLELRPPSDRAAEPGWERASEALAVDIERFWCTPPTQMLTRSLAPPAQTLGSLGVVRASSVPELTASLAPEPAPPIGEALRKAFVASLGPAGDPVFRRVVRTLRKEPSAIVTADLPQVARLADEAIADFGGALDVADASRDLSDGAKRLHARLAGLAAEGR